MYAWSLLYYATSLTVLCDTLGDAVLSSVGVRVRTEYTERTVLVQCGYYSHPLKLPTVPDASRWSSTWFENTTTEHERRLVMTTRVVGPRRGDPGGQMWNSWYT